jgi:molybdopterin-guanine dinucleotide biosynthesis protein A
MPSFSAALLAGGTSKRMGRDKALLPISPSGQLLWQRQWQVLGDLQPREIFWSGPPRPQMPARARIVTDAVKSAGPLAGIGACLEALRDDLLVVLAVDLPQMNTPFLRGLLAQCRESRGAVVRHGDFFEPLAAIYPKHLHVLAADHLAQGRRALQDFIHEAVKLDALLVLPLEEDDAPLFRNLNAPSDL